MQAQILKVKQSVITISKYFLKNMNFNKRIAVIHLVPTKKLYQDHCELLTWRPRSFSQEKQDSMSYLDKNIVLHVESKPTPWL